MLQRALNFSLVLTFALNQIPGLNALPTVLSKTVDKVLGTPLRLVNDAADKTIAKAKGLLAGKDVKPGQVAAMAVNSRAVPGDAFKIWLKADGKGGVDVMRTVDNRPDQVFNLATDVKDFAQLAPALQARLTQDLANLKRDGAAAVLANRKAKEAAPALPGKPVNFKVTPEVQAQTAALKLAKASEEALLQTLIDVKVEFREKTRRRQPRGQFRTQVVTGQGRCAETPF